MAGRKGSFTLCFIRVLGITFTGTVGSGCWLGVVAATGVNRGVVWTGIEAGPGVGAKLERDWVVTNGLARFSPKFI